MARARAERFQQESALAGYVSIARQRWSGGIGLAAAGGLGPLGRTRLAARFESVARMSWDHERGAWAELIASRAVAPIVGEIEPSEADDDIIFVLPYYPGRDRLWPMTELGDAFEDARGWISHPLDAGSDSLYHFALAGALVLTLPSGQPIRLREVQVRPVRPDGRLIVGSLWLDEATGALVRAAYRPSVAVDLWPFMEQNFDSGDRETFRRFGPFRGNVEEVVIEHGLYAGRFWLPRVRIAHAEGTAKGGRVTISIEQSFSYEDVRALPPGAVQAPQVARVPEPERRYDYWYDEQRNARSTAARPCREPADSLTGRLPNDSLPLLEGVRVQYADGIPMRVLYPCRRAALMASPELPPSIYSPSDELFTDQDLGRLRQEVGQALAISNQAEWQPQAATVRYGLDGGLLRYNRIEALSVGVRVDRELGKGYRWDALARLGAADLEPGVEFNLRRGSGHGERRLGVYRRLDAVNDWGNPFGLSASLGALFLGRDDGIYHRTLGAEVGGTSHRIAGGPAVAWRVFVEEQRSARVETDFSIASAIGDASFRPNVAATEGLFAGAAATVTFALGANPMGTQLSGTLKGEGAGGERDNGRGSVELRLARGLGRGVLGAVTGAAGGSLGELPAQRLWYLGGPLSIHAHHPGAASGNAFWMGRAEITKGLPIVRPIIFGDVGWAGDRSTFATSARRLWAAGFGVAALDGLLRFDVSRALDDSKRWTFDIFIEVR
jgi:hypothetical protein